MQELEPPKDLIAERHILGSIFCDNSVIAEVATKLWVEQFYGFHHQHIFDRMLQLFREGKPINPYTVGVALAEKNLLLEVGGAPDIVEIAESVMTVVDVGCYINRVRDMFIYRTLSHFAPVLYDEACRHRQSPTDLIKLVNDKISEIQNLNQSHAPMPIRDIIPKVLQEIQENSNKANETSRIFSGLISLDEMLGPLKRKSFIVVAARPSIGKTALATNIAVYNAMNGKNVLFLSLEQSDTELVARILSDKAGINGRKIQYCEAYDGLDIQRIIEIGDRLVEVPLYISDCSGIGMTQIMSTCQQMKVRDKLDLIIVDYVGLIAGENKQAKRFEQVSEISRTLKGLAKQMDVPLMALVQLNREAEGKKPVLAHLRDSGSLEQDADVVLLMHRGKPKEDYGQYPPNTMLQIAKHRNGQTGEVWLRFIPEFTRFECV